MRQSLRAPATVIAALCLSSCSPGSASAPKTAGGDAGWPDADDIIADDGAAGAPFAASSATVYVAKIKNVLVGLPATQAEIDDVQSDPGKLKELLAT